MVRAYARIMIQVLHKSALYEYSSALRENVKRSLSYTSIGELAPSVNLPCKADARLDRTLFFRRELHWLRRTLITIREDCSNSTSLFPPFLSLSPSTILPILALFTNLSYFLSLVRTTSLTISLLFLFLSIFLPFHERTGAPRSLGKLPREETVCGFELGPE